MKHKRQIYLQMKTIEEARRIFFGRVSVEKLSAEETIPVRQAVERMTARPVFARFSAPTFHAAAMDGIAVKAEETFGTTVDKPKHLRVGRETFFVNTGQPMPRGCNAVIMIEQVQIVSDETVLIEAAAYPWQYVRKVGEDIVATELILPQNHRIRPYDVGALLNGGIFTVTVTKRPNVVVVPTGSELVAPEKLINGAPQPGQVVESNSAVLGALIGAAGGRHVEHPIVPDDYEQIRNAVRTAVDGDNQVVIVSAGSSAGSEDYTASVIRELGEVLVHGVTMMPGKPTVLGMIGDTPVMGNPGYPVSAIIAFEEFIRPLLYRLHGLRPPERRKVEAVTARKLPSKLGLDEFVRVKLGQVHEQIIATPLPRGAGSVTTLTEADGIMRIPGNVEGIQSGQPAAIELLKDLSQIKQTVVIVGSHDNTLDILANEMMARDPSYTLSSSNVGSLGGLIALGKGFSHVAGSHLLDTETDTYNITYVNRHLSKLPVKLINLVFREQGLIVAKGNPKGISGVADLKRPDVRFINRQAGSGTRILLDYKLKSSGISTASIAGYEQEEFTHMSIAVAVLSGTADVGLGIYAAARALDLDFIPIVTEEYDLVIPALFFEDDKIRFMLDTISSSSFKDKVRALGGYDTSQTGTLIADLEGTED
jgi:putative molybdopterin biosynthesis protein